MKPLLDKDLELKNRLENETPKLLLSKDFYTLDAFILESINFHTKGILPVRIQVQNS